MNNSSGYISSDGKKTAMVKMVTMPVVEFFENGQLIQVETFPNNTLDYAEDAAENYVMGILKVPK